MILMKRLTRCIAISVILIIEAINAASGSQHPNVDEEIRATWASVFDGHLQDAITRAEKLLTEIDPAQDGGKHIGVQARPWWKYFRS